MVEADMRHEEVREERSLTPAGPPPSWAPVASTYVEQNQNRTEPPPPTTTHSPPGQQHGAATLDAVVSQMDGTPTSPTANHIITEKVAAVAAVNEQQVDTEPVDEAQCVAAGVKIATAAGAAEDTMGSAETAPAQDPPDSRSLYRVAAPPVPEKIAASGDDQHDVTEDSCSQFESLVRAMDRCEMLRREVESATAQAGAFHKMLALPCATPGPWLDYLNRHLKTAGDLRKEMHAKLETEFTTVLEELRAVKSAGEEISGVVKEKLQRLTEARSAMATPVGLAVSMGLPRLAVNSFGPGQIQRAAPRAPFAHENKGAAVDEEMNRSQSQTMSSRFVGVHWFMKS
jgi:hypothetical protein